MIRSAKLLLTSLILMTSLHGNAQQLRSVKKIEKLISNVIDSAFATSVQISAFDTLTNRAAPVVFSGVAVSPEGHILTVGHASSPNQIYQVTFTNGSKHIARGLGRIAINEPGKDLDMAMMKITKPGKWPFAKMGTSNSLKINEPCVSISYPFSFSAALPKVRFGKLTDVNPVTGYIVSTCKMEPGDSGGPLYDSKGQVIGIHSWVKSNEDLNYEVPIDLYKKYWTALNKTIDYKTLPVADSLFNDKAQKMSVTIPDIQELADVSEKLRKSVAVIRSKKAENYNRILGTIVTCISPTELIQYVVSKSSAVALNPEIEINGNFVPAEVIKRDEGNDLVLLRIDSRLPEVLTVKSNQKSPVLKNDALGKFMVSPLGMGQKKVGVLSSLNTALPIRLSAGYLGANATFLNDKITITAIAAGSPAEKYLKLKDQIIGINGVTVSQPPHLGAELMKRLAGDSLTIDLMRENAAIQFKIYLPPYPVGTHVAARFEGGRNIRSDGFPGVLVQDAAVKADECGGPVFDVDGRFIGINIARHSRTSTIIMPFDVVRNFIF